MVVVVDQDFVGGGHVGGRDFGDCGYGFLVLDLYVFVILTLGVGINEQRRECQWRW